METLSIAEIANECAEFAHDNFPAEPGWDHSPLAMWGSWHDKEGITEVPEMPDEFRTQYLRECLRIGGSELWAEVAK